MPANPIRITIPEPCSVRLSEMPQVDEQHVHCNVCNHTLTDFSQMSDTELALWFSQKKGKVCGVYNQTQLDRLIHVPVPKPMHKRWLSAIWLLPLAWFSKPAQAQTNEIIKSKPPVSARIDAQSATPVQEEIMELETVLLEQPINGTVSDKTTKQPIAYALVVVRNGDAIVTKATTDASGNFKLELPEGIAWKGLQLTVTRIGYDTARLALTGDEKNLSFTLTEKEEVLTKGEKMISHE